MNGVSEPQNLAFSGKAEFLINPVEISAAIWAKENYHPVYALDLTTRLFNWVDFKGEASFADSDTTPYYSTASIQLQDTDLRHIIHITFQTS